MLNENAALLHHFFRLPKTQRVGHLPTHASEYDFQWVMQPLQDFVQGVDQTVAEIKHGPDGLMRGWDNIERATVNGRDHEARWNMMCASMQGVLAFQKGLEG